MVLPRVMTPTPKLLHVAGRTRDARVLILLDASAEWSRGVLKGFTAVVRRKGWMLLHYHTMVDLRWLVRVWKPTVVVLQWSLYADVADALESCTVIAVNEDSSAHGIASVCVDETAIGTLAAQHLMTGGLRDLTTFRFNEGSFAVTRERAFTEAVRARKARYVPGWWIDGAEPSRLYEDPAAIIGWLEQLPKPCGIFACTDSWATVVARYAQVARVRIPEEVALIGVDNDPMDCELASPPLSSVCIPWRTVGEEAAGLVGRALAGAAVAGERVVVPPIDVIARRSTDVAVIDDPIVARAMSWIAQHLGGRLTLNLIAQAAMCSRQSLEQRFQAAIGRTVMQEVRRARVDMARRLLSTTLLPLPAIAHQCGFTSAALLSVAFRRATGIPPGTYRRRFRGAHSTDG
jgi:LacI family transcriptional regulator